MLSRRRRRALWALSASIATGAAAVIGLGLSADTAADAQLAAAASPAPPASPAPVQRPVPDFSALLARDLQGGLNDPPPPPPPPQQTGPTSPPPPAFSGRLVATIVERGRSYAVLSLANKTVRAAVGDVVEGATVTDVRPTVAVLRAGGQTIELQLPEKPPATTAVSHGGTTR